MQSPGTWLDRIDALGVVPPRVSALAWTPAERRVRANRGDPIAVESVNVGVWVRESPDGLALDQGSGSRNNKQLLVTSD